MAAIQENGLRGCIKSMQYSRNESNVRGVTYKNPDYLR